MNSLRNVASNAIASPARQGLVEIFGQSLRPRQPSIQSHANRTNQKTFWNNSGVYTGSQAARGLLDHLLLFATKVQNLCQAAIAERAVGLKTHGIHRHLAGIVERPCYRLGNAAGSWLGVDPQPGPAILRCVRLEAHATQHFSV